MEFWKMNGAGNDFIIINNFKGNIPAEKFPYIAETLCERHLSIGADGFMVVAQPSEEYKDKAKSHKICRKLEEINASYNVRLSYV